MSDNITIRKYNKADKSTLLELLKLNTPSHFAPEEMTDFIEYLDHEIEYYFVVLLQNKIVGSGGINFSDDQSIGKISWDIIDPNYHGRKIGTFLMKHRIDLLRSLPHIRKVTVRTSQLAYKFYEKQGFEITEIVTDYWAKGFDLYSMKLLNFKE